MSRVAVCDLNRVATICMYTYNMISYMAAMRPLHIDCIGS